MKQRQMCQPILVTNGKTSHLTRLSFEDRNFDEDQLQRLLYENPTLIPAGDIEPIFEDLVPICRELPTTSGRLDLLYITPRGYLCLVETKLWRNPEARRSAIAQLIDYTQCIARWSYNELVEAIDRSPNSGKSAKVDASNNTQDSLYARMLNDHEDLVEDEFIDAVSRNLRLGRFLLLIVGDGIREDIESMTTFLQQTPQLGYTFGLVEIGMYRLNNELDEPLLVQPRVLARTREVTRAVVEIHNYASKEVATTVRLPPESKSGKATGTTITEHDFFDRLGKQSPRAVETAKYLVSQFQGLGLEPEWNTSSCIFRYEDDTTGRKITPGKLLPNGSIGSFGQCSVSSQRAGVSLAVIRKYLDAVQKLIPGAAVYDDGINPNNHRILDVRVGPALKRDRPSIESIAPHRDDWVHAISDFIADIEADTDREAD